MARVKMIDRITLTRYEKGEKNTPISEIPGKGSQKTLEEKGRCFLELHVA